MRRSEDDGFTLVELLVVVIIIGILAAIAIPMLLEQRESAMVAAAKTDARNAAIVIEAVYAETDTYPADDASFQGLIPTGDVVVSPQVTLTFTLDSPNAFRIVADHAGNGAGQDAVWDSDAGGLQ